MESASGAGRNRKIKQNLPRPFGERAGERGAPSPPTHHGRYPAQPRNQLKNPDNLRPERLSPLRPCGPPPLPGEDLMRAFRSSEEGRSANRKRRPHPPKTTYSSSKLIETVTESVDSPICTGGAAEAFTIIAVSMRGIGIGGSMAEPSEIMAMRRTFMPAACA